MRRIKKYFVGLVILSVLLLLTVSALPVVSASSIASGSRFSGTVNVPQWEKGDKWGYKIPQYAYSSDYYGVGFEVVGTETINGDECYKVKVWWDASFGAEETEYDYNVPGFSYSYNYDGYVYYTKDKLAIAKFTTDLQMQTKYDGSKFTTNYNYPTRAQDSYDFSDYTDYLEKMKKWKYDISYDFSIGYTYTPPFVMYDYPLELDKHWNSTSEVEISWEYSTHIWMNSAMKDDVEEMYGGEYPGLGAVNEEGSDSTSFKLVGSFEITGKDTVETETGSHEVFTIAYDISVGYTRATYTTPPEDYGGMEVPGGDATLNLIVGSEGYGTSYFDPESGYPQKMDTGSYYTESYTTVEPSTIENSYNDKVDSEGSGDGDDGGPNIILLILAGVIVGVVLLVIILVVVLMKRANRYQAQQNQYQRYPDRYPPQTQQQQYPREHQPPIAQQVQQPPPPPPRIKEP